MTGYMCVIYVNICHHCRSHCIIGATPVYRFPAAPRSFTLYHKVDFWSWRKSTKWIQNLVHGYYSVNFLTRAKHIMKKKNIVYDCKTIHLLRFQKTNVFRKSNLNYSRNILINFYKNGLLQSCLFIVVQYLICHRVVIFLKLRIFFILKPLLMGGGALYLY